MSLGHQPVVQTGGGGGEQPSGQGCLRSASRRPDNVIESINTTSSVPTKLYLRTGVLLQGSLTLLYSETEGAGSIFHGFLEGYDPVPGGALEGRRLRRAVARGLRALEHVAPSPPWWGWRPAARSHPPGPLS